jgi:hypothetical protein
MAERGTGAKGAPRGRVTRRTAAAAVISCGLFAWGCPLHAAADTALTAADWAGTWRGTYACNQGATGLDLTITPAEKGGVTAIFSFHAVLFNPLVPSGEFAMEGELGPEPGRLRLRAGGWILQPPDYVTVDLDGTFDEASKEYRGTVIGPGCTSFRLQRGTPI